VRDADRLRRAATHRRAMDQLIHHPIVGSIALERGTGGGSIPPLHTLSNRWSLQLGNGYSHLNRGPERRHRSSAARARRDPPVAAPPAAPVAGPPGVGARPDALAGLSPGQALRWANGSASRVHRPTALQAREPTASGWRPGPWRSPASLSRRKPRPIVHGRDRGFDHVVEGEQAHLIRR